MHLVDFFRRWHRAHYLLTSPRCPNYTPPRCVFAAGDGLRATTRGALTARPTLFAFRACGPTEPEMVLRIDAPEC